MQLPARDGLGSALLLLAALSAIGGCGSSGQATTAPSALTRCAVTVSAVDAAIPARGGNGTVRVTAARECSWTASVEGQWLSVTNGSGQGEGAVEFTASANPDPVARRGALIVNGQRAAITQEAAPCAFTLSSSASAFGPSGGSGEVEVRASSAMCQWTAAADADWISVRRASGQGTTPIPFDVQPTAGPPRTATIVIGGQQHSVTQSQGCVYSIAPGSHQAPPAGSRGTVAIATGAGCPWTAASNVPWITFEPTAGSGPASLAFTVQPTSGAQRTAAAVIAGQAFTVVQSAGCTYSVRPESHLVEAGGGSLTVQVETGSGCPWTAAIEVPWIVVQGASSGTGNGTVSLGIAATTGPARTATLMIAGRSVTISQAGACAYQVAPGTASIPAAGGTGRVTVTAASGCAWTATSSAAWLSITAGTSGTGNGEVRYSAAPTLEPTRVATLTVAGQTVTVTQRAACTVAIAPEQAAIEAAGGPTLVAITAPDGCEWTASSAVPWIAVDSAASGSGSGTLRLIVGANTGPARTGTVAIAGLTFTVVQASGCTVALSQTTRQIPKNGGSRSVDVVAAEGCSWTAVSQDPWIAVTNGATGTGNGTVEFSVDPNPTDQPRNGTIIIGGTPLSVRQQ